MFTRMRSGNKASTQRNFDNNECAICLGPHVDKSQPACGHVFCFQCLVDWCRVKLECPTCKQRFEKFIHNIKSPNNFETYTPEEPSNSDDEYSEDVTRIVLDTRSSEFNQIVEDPLFRRAFILWYSRNPDIRFRVM